MIYGVNANNRRFHSVTFEAGLNIVLADRTDKSTHKDSRNGLGKTLLIEVIHFCLGSSLKKSSGLGRAPLSGWEFSVTLGLPGGRITVTRSIDQPRTVTLTGEVREVFPNRRTTDRLVLRVKEWTAALGELWFGLDGVGREHKWSPSFRSLFSYIARRGRDAFSIPFENHRKQQEWDRQVNVAYLIGLAWEDASAFQVLREEKRALTEIRKAVRLGWAASLAGSVGELEADRIRLSQEVMARGDELQRFHVHPQYEDIQSKANSLTEELHALANEEVRLRRMLSNYEAATDGTQALGRIDIEELYRQAGVELPDMVVRRLHEVGDFHEALVRNRRAFLEAEIRRVQHRLGAIAVETASCDRERGMLLDVLKTHGALNEYTKLQEVHARVVADLRILEARLDNVKKLRDGERDLRVRGEQLQLRALRGYEERVAARERAVGHFNANTEALYSVPGKLLIDVGSGGFKFGVEIQRMDSQGVDLMMVWSFDVAIAQCLLEWPKSPRMLIHDSTVFSGVDRRQVALALARARALSHSGGWQYICTMNSDEVPTSDLPPGFAIDPFVRLRLTDENEEGALLGFRY